MLKHKEYRVCDRCFKELDEKGKIEVCCGDDTRWYDLCDECYEAHLEYAAEMQAILEKRHEIAKKYKFGPYLPKEDKDEN